jgi:hypothetical protein
LLRYRTGCALLLFRLERRLGLLRPLLELPLRLLLELLPLRQRLERPLRQLQVRSLPGLERQRRLVRRSAPKLP